MGNGCKKFYRFVRIVDVVKISLYENRIQNNVLLLFYIRFISRDILL